MKKQLLISTILFALSSNIVQANEVSADSTTSQSKHTFGFQISNGSAEYKGSSDDGDGIGQSYLYYNYKLSPTYSIEAGINGGTDVDDWECSKEYDDDWECHSNNDPFFNLQANKLSYGGLVLALKANFQLTEKNSLYAKIGGQFYDYEFSRSSVKLDKDDGFGAVVEAGWQYRWHSGWGINAGMTYMDMGDLKTTTLNTGVSYAF
ncbi:outer membrane beta-barrel protein [Aliikangiella sp. IMCC44359]|uniref:outer membrane beta-barrel protein n=1 Tax=Aliikangiella sp. IMCC44359 TaxID=3459125 RepID=UPI00403AE05A